jgi:hypothetical protein
MENQDQQHYNKLVLANFLFLWKTFGFDHDQ